MIRFVYTLLPVLLFSTLSCRNTENENQNDELQGHLPAHLVHNPHTLDSSDSKNVKKIGQLVFTDTLHDFGNVKEGETLVYEFEFQNKGNSDVLIDEAKASCGCTVPAFPKYPIQPGKRDKIYVSFNSQGKKGYNDKAVIVQTNAIPSVYTLHIQANVE